MRAFKQPPPPHLPSNSFRRTDQQHEIKRVYIYIYAYVYIFACHRKFLLSS